MPSVGNSCDLKFMELCIGITDEGLDKPSNLPQNSLKIRTPEKFVVITLKFEEGGFTIGYCILLHPEDADNIANSVDPDQTAPHLGLHCRPRRICPKTWDHYGK